MTEHRDTVVVDRGGGGGMGAILGIVAIIVLLGAVWYFALGPGSSPSGTGTNNNGGSTPTQQAPASS